MALKLNKMWALTTSLCVPVLRRVTNVFRSVFRSNTQWRARRREQERQLITGADTNEVTPFALAAAERSTMRSAPAGLTQPGRERSTLEVERDAQCRETGHFR